MKKEYYELKKLYLDYRDKNLNGVITGREFYDLVFEVKSIKILKYLEVQSDENAKFILRQAISLGFTFNEFAAVVGAKRKCS